MQKVFMAGHNRLACALLGWYGWKGERRKACLMRDLLVVVVVVVIALPTMAK